jgi:tetratricopeptide (TPR) repeat protein
MEKVFEQIVYIVILLLVLSGISYSNDISIQEYQLNNLQGYELLKKSKYNKAIIYFKKSIQNNSKYSIAYNNLGATYYRMKKYFKAKKYFRQAIKLRSNYTKAYINLAACYFWQGKYLTAYHYYRKGKSIDKKYVKERINIAKSKNKVEKKLKKNPNDNELKEIYNKLLEYEKLKGN